MHSMHSMLLFSVLVSGYPYLSISIVLIGFEIVVVYFIFYFILFFIPLFYIVYLLFTERRAVKLTRFPATFTWSISIQNAPISL